MGAATTALAPIASIQPKKIQATQTVGSIERMRIGPRGYVIWPGTDKEFKI